MTESSNSNAADHRPDESAAAGRFARAFAATEAAGFTREALHLLSSGMTRGSNGGEMYVSPAALVAAVCAIAQERFGIQAEECMHACGFTSSRQIGRLALLMSEVLHVPPSPETIEDYVNLPAFAFRTVEAPRPKSGARPIR